MTQIEPENTRVEWEGALVERARAGDTRAFERLYREHVGRVYGLCLRMTRDPAIAEDCTQETFINAWKALARFETRSSLATWLHRIAVNATLAKRRKASVVMESTSIDDEDGAIESEWTLETPLEVNEIEVAIEQLPEGARDVLVLHVIYGYSHLEAAQMLGVAEGTCKAQLHRARGLLRDKLGVEVR
jgi:RNA polymerase sigma-70 factor (ECF subfamily)